VSRPEKKAAKKQAKNKNRFGKNNRVPLRRIFAILWSAKKLIGSIVA
jgi:hypothetical protein